VSIFKSQTQLLLQTYCGAHRSMDSGERICSASICNRVHAGFPRGIESIEKVLNCETGFQNLEKVWNLAKI